MLQSKLTMTSHRVARFQQLNQQQQQQQGGQELQRQDDQELQDDQGLHLRAVPDGHVLQDDLNQVR